jgi:hypothetical protein
VTHHAAASTQNQALCAILFLYRHVLQQDLDLRLFQKSTPLFGRFVLFLRFALMPYGPVTTNLAPAPRPKISGAYIW